MLTGKPCEMIGVLRSALCLAAKKRRGGGPIGEVLGDGRMPNPALNAGPGALHGKGW